MPAEPAARFQTLFSPLQIGPVTLPNRVVFLPHGNRYPIDDLPGDRELAYYGERAKGGVGLITYGSQTVHALEGNHTVNVTRPEVVPLYQRLTDAVHGHGTLISAQLVHWGVLRQTASEQGLDWQLPYGASSRPRGETFTREMGRDDLQRAIEAYRLGARHAKRGGFDGIQVRLNHALLQEFVSPFTNRRADSYGGSLENRLRFPLEVIAAVRDEIGSGVFIDVRFCVDEVIPGGYGLEEGTAIGRMLAESGLVDLLTVGVGASPDGGIYQTEEIPPYPQREGYAVYAAAALKATVSLPVVACGRITMPGQAEEILTGGQADLIGLARGLITDPEWVNKARTGAIDDIRRCLGYNEVCLRQAAHRVTCVWNPAAGRERDLGAGTLVYAGHSKQVAIIGGGPAGLKVAETAARRGHRVTVYERSDQLGGQIRLATRFPHRSHLGEIPAFYEHQLRKLDVAIRLNTALDAASIAALGVDAVVLATGALPYVPLLPGFQQAHVVTVWDLAETMTVPGDRVLVYDTQGLWPALSAAELLARQGKRVDIVTPRPAVGTGIAAGPLLLWNERVAGHGITRIADTALVGVDGGTVTFRSANTRIGLDWTASGYDAIVLSCGSRPNDSLYRPLSESGLDVRLVGDAEAPLRLERSIYAAELLGRTL